MKFTCYKNDLIEALRTVIRSAAVNPMTPILSGVYLNATDNYLEMQANNFTSAISLKIPVSTEVPGEVVVGGKKFFDFIRNVPEDTVKFFGEDAANTFSLESGGASAELLTMPVMEFPKIRTPETDKSFKIRAVALKNLIRKTVFAVARDDERPLFKGCNFQTDGSKITVAATNTHRIAIAKDIVRDNYDDGSFVVPAEVLRSLMQHIDPNDVENYVEIKYSSRQASFKFNNVYLTARLNEGEFPDYRKIFEGKTFSTTVNLNKVELREAVEFVLLVAKENENNTVKFDIRADNMLISADSPDIGDAKKPIDVEVDGDLMEIAFNGEYFVDALRTLDCQKLQLQFVDSHSPVFVHEMDSDAFYYIVTPVRI